MAVSYVNLADRADGKSKRASQYWHEYHGQFAVKK